MGDLSATQGNDKEGNSEINKICITPTTVECKVGNSTHNFKATKGYVLGGETFVLCPRHLVMIGVHSVSRTTGENIMNIPEPVNEKFFLKKLVERLISILENSKSSRNNLFELFFRKPVLTQDETKNLEQTLSILERLNENYSLPYKLTETSGMDRNELLTKYKACADIASIRRLYDDDLKRSGFAIREEFIDATYPRIPGAFFGVKPTLIVYWGSEIDFVLPHTASWLELKFNLNNFRQGIPTEPIKHQSRIGINALLSQLNEKLETQARR